jgi:hypothetical protein
VDVNRRRHFDCLIDAIYEATQRAGITGQAQAIYNRGKTVAVAQLGSYRAEHILEVFQP